mmetsp:Transcript_44883/g.118513  ORF Transcript_44883/g.118513 Transcript_44883/m.118513 type:complete len:370 (+) Transcript_44883:71-1180(+)
MKVLFLTLAGVEGALRAHKSSLSSCAGTHAKAVVHMTDTLSLANPTAFKQWMALKDEAEDLPTPPKGAPRKIAFAFLVEQDLPYAQLWYKWFQSAPAQNYTLLVHQAQGDDSDNDYTTDPFWGKAIVPTMNSSWCHMEHARLAMARKALQDPSVAQIVWLSGDSVPLKSFADVYADLAHSNKTSFCIDKTWTRAEMWAAWARPMASLFARHEDKIFNLFRGVDCDVDTPAERRDLLKHCPNVCEDEDFYYNQYLMLGKQHRIRQHCVMWTDWSDPNKGFHHPKGVGDSLRKCGMITGDGGCNHPNEFYQVCGKGIDDLVDNKKALFARKFRDATVVFEEDGKQMTKSLNDWLLESLDLSGTADDDDDSK